MDGLLCHEVTRVLSSLLVTSSILGGRHRWVRVGAGAGEEE